MSPPHEERRPRKGAVHDLGQRSTQSITRGSDPHAALMADLDWSIRWLDRGHEHWWMRLERWRREGRAA
jgi:hypothetical protein